MDLRGLRQACVLVSLLGMAGFLGGCVTGSGGQSFGEVLGEATGEAMSAGMDDALGKNRGNIDKVSILREDDNGLLLEARYSRVRYPQGAKLLAEAYGAAGLLTEYTCLPVDVTGRSGLARLELAYQQGGWSSGEKPAVSRVVVKMFREDDPMNAFASAGLDKAIAGGEPEAPAVIVPQGDNGMAVAPMKPLQMQPMTVQLPFKVFSSSMGTSTQCGDSGKSDSFFATAHSAYLRVELHNVKAGDVYHYKWYDPAGKLYQTRKITKSKDVAKECHANNLLIDKKAPAGKLGQWTVVFYHNNKPMVSRKFTIMKPMTVVPLQMKRY